MGAATRPKFAFSNLRNSIGHFHVAILAVPMALGLLFAKKRQVSLAFHPCLSTRALQCHHLLEQTRENSGRLWPSITLHHRHCKDSWMDIHSNGISLVDQLVLAGIFSCELDLVLPLISYAASIQFPSVDCWARDMV